MGGFQPEIPISDGTALHVSQKLGPVSCMTDMSEVHIMTTRVVVVITCVTHEIQIL